jgi:hypothetical protein
MVVHKKRARLRWAKMMGEAALTTALMTHAEEVASRIQDVRIANWMPAPYKICEIMEVSRARRRPPEADVIQFVRANACKIQARPDREDRKTRIVLDATEALLSDGKQQRSIADNARRGIVHLRVIDA